MTTEHMDVSKNRGTPKWMVNNGNPIKIDDLGGTTIFGNIHMHPVEVVNKLSRFRNFLGSQRSQGYSNETPNP